MLLRDDERPEPAIILVADDDKAFRAYLTALLQDAGYTVLTAPDGHRALQVYFHSRPNLVITDIVMPDSSGIELITHIRRFDASLPIIAMSGAERFIAELGLISAEIRGADASLQKPFPPELLLTQVQDLLRSPRSHMARKH